MGSWHDTSPLRRPTGATFGASYPFVPTSPDCYEGHCDPSTDSDPCFGPRVPFVGYSGHSPGPRSLPTLWTHRPIPFRFLPKFPSLPSYAVSALPCSPRRGCSPAALVGSHPPRRDRRGSACNDTWQSMSRMASNSVNLEGKSDNEGMQHPDTGTLRE